MYKSLGIVFESTDGYASNINGAAKASHQTIKQSTRANLMGSLMPNGFWCFAGQYSGFTYNQCIIRTTNRPPALVYTKKLVKSKKLHPFGSRVKIIKELKTKRALSARTSGDLRADTEDEITMEEIDEHSSFDGRFLGYGNDPAVMLVYCECALSHKI